jgi:hypothetical protein
MATPEEQAALDAKAAEDKAAADVKANAEKDAQLQADPKYKAASEAASKLENLLKANDVEDVDDLVALLESGKKVHGKVADLSKIDEIIKKAQTLDQYEEYWAAERKKGETPEQTIARLQKENQALASKTKAEEAAKREATESQKAVEAYESEVKAAVNSAEGLSDSEKAFLAWSLGVGNECNEITITDKKQVKRVVNSGMKKYTELVKSMKDEGVKEYLAGKREIPKVPSGGGDSPATPAPQLPKGLRGLRNAFKEMVTPKGG